jgi:hypothetical protein
MPPAYQSQKQQLGGIIKSAPMVCSWGVKRMDMVAQGADDVLYHRGWSSWDNKWTPWKTGYGKIKSAPAIVSFGEHNLLVFAKGMDDNIWHTHGDGGDWNPANWVFFGKPATTDLEDYIDPAAGLSFYGVMIFVLGKDRRIYYKYSSNSFKENSGNSEQWSSIPEIVINNEVINPQWMSANGQFLFVHGSDGVLYKTRWAEMM